MLDLHCCMWAFLQLQRSGSSLLLSLGSTGMRAFRPWELPLPGPRAQAQQSLLGMWDLPNPGSESMSPTLAGRLFTTEATREAPPLFSFLYHLTLQIFSSAIIYLLSLNFMTTPKPSTVWITINCGKFWKRREYQTTWPASWETCMQVRKQQLELDTDQQTGSK